MNSAWCGAELIVNGANMKLQAAQGTAAPSAIVTCMVGADVGLQAAHSTLIAYTPV
jgi:hypothetical protein